MHTDHATAEDPTTSRALEDYSTREKYGIPLFKKRETRVETNAIIDEFLESPENRKWLMSELIEGPSKLPWDKPKHFIGPLITYLLDDKLKADRLWESNLRLLTALLSFIFLYSV